MSSKLWLGTQDSYDEYQRTLSAERPEVKLEGMTLEQALVQNMTRVQDGVGVVTVKGPLISGSAGLWGLYTSVTGYDDLQNAVAEMASHKDVKSILMVVDSGGGAVAGVQDVGNLISRVSKYKPMVTYSGGIMCSAALWLGASADHVMVSDTAIVGSIGVLQVHKEYSRQLENDGIKATVIRSGEQKALANSYEPLTDKAKENMQKQADHLYDVFLGHVADRRGVAISTADKKFGQGQEFVGSQAKSVGLVDSVGTLEDAFKKAKKLGETKVGAKKTTNSSQVRSAAFAASAGTADNLAIVGESNLMATKIITDEQLAAMSAGVEVPGLEALAGHQAGTGGAGEGAESESTGDNDAGAKTGAGEADKPEDTNTTGGSTTASTDAISVLTQMLSGTQTELAMLKVEHEASLKAQAEREEQFTAAVDIVRNSVRTMGLHFGIDKEAVAAMSATDVLAEHTRLAARFKEKFKAGTVAASVDTAETKKATPDTAQAQMLARAARFPTHVR